MAIVVSENDRYKSYVATSGQTVFIYDFPVLDEESVGVIQNGTELTYGTEYTVSGVGSASGGNITLTTGATEDDSIIVYGKTPYAREDYYTGTYVGVTAGNTSEEKIQFQLQQLNRDLNRCIRNDLTDGAITELPSIAERKSQLASWDSDGKLSYTDPTTGALADYMKKDQNLSDVVSVSDARDNLGLGDSATKNVGIIAGTVASGSDSRFLTSGQKGALVGGSTTDASTLHTHSNLISTTSIGQPNGVAELNAQGKLKVAQIPSNVVTTAATGSSDNEIVVFNSTSGANIKNSSKSLPSGSVVGTTDTQTLTNKTIDADSNTISNIEVDNLKAGVIDTDLTSTSSSDDTIPSAKATKTYADTKVGELTNLGTGEEITKQILAGTLQSKTIKAGIGVAITSDGDEITITSGALLKNVGTGTGKVYKSFDGTYHELRSIKDGTHTSVTNNTDDITVDISGTLVNGSDASLLHTHESLYLEKADNLSDLASAETARTNLGLGTIATQNADSVNITGGDVTVTDTLGFSDGGSIVDTTESMFITAPPSTIGGGYIFFKTNGGAGVQHYFAPGGDFVITGNMYNSVGSTYDLGFPTSRFATLYCDTISGGTITGITDLAIADGGTGASTATAGFDNLSPTTTKGDLIVSDGTNNVRLPVGTDTYILASDSGETSGVKWINPTSTGTLELISSATASNSASIDFTDLSSSYVRYELFIDGLIPASDASIYFRTSTDNGSNFDAGASDYAFAYLYGQLKATSPAYGVIGNESTDKIQIFGGILSTATPGYTGVVRISGHADTSNYTIVNSNGYAAAAPTTKYTSTASGVRLSTTAVNAIRIVMDSGNIASGKFYLYGVKG